MYKFFFPGGGGRGQVNVVSGVWMYKFIQILLPSLAGGGGSGKCSF